MCSTMSPSRSTNGGGHHDSHHRHSYDVLGEDPTRSAVTCIAGLDDVPTLGDVIEEARSWYYENLDAIEARQERG